MRITRLHMVLAVLGILCLGAGAWISMRGAVQPSQPPSLGDVPAPVTPAAESAPVTHPDSGAARPVAIRIATVGEAYKPLMRHFGEIAAIAQPLRAAKAQFAEGHLDEARVSADLAWKAIKTFKEEHTHTYHVVQGDTLWKIALKVSPVHAGAGWVAIWESNKNLVKDFDRIEVGWTLLIPSQRARYVMPFWNPR